MLKGLDSLLNRVTIYRLMLYFLFALWTIALIFSFLKILPYDFINLFLTSIFIVFACLSFNQIFAKISKVSPNIESQLITGYILAFIVGPLEFLPNVLFLMLVSAIAMASKYVLLFRKQHFFNPAALAVVITAIFLGRGASWWIGDPLMLPFVLIFGLVMVRKLKRFHLIISFLLSFLVALSVLNLETFLTNPAFLRSVLLSPPLLFFTFVMLTEPITSPADRRMRIYFGVFTGIIYAFYTLYLDVFYTLELSLLSANLVFRFLSSNKRYMLVLKEKREIAKSIWEFIFEPEKNFNFTPGQFMEWTVPHKRPDARGVRRYFTIASSPTEKNIKIAVKVPDEPSTFKKSLKDMKKGDEVYTANLEGDFILQKDPNLHYVFIAGGIGVTPYRSIIKYMLDNRENHPVTLFYIAKNDKEFVYDELFETAKSVGVNTIRVISDTPPDRWKGETGHLNADIIKRHVDDPESALYYISGPPMMVDAYKDLLHQMGLKGSQIKTDYFPGY